MFNVGDLVMVFQKNLALNNLIGLVVKKFDGIAFYYVFVKNNKYFLSEGELNKIINYEK